MLAILRVDRGRLPYFGQPLVPVVVVGDVAGLSAIDDPARTIDLK